MLPCGTPLATGRRSDKVVLCGRLDIEKINNYKTSVSQVERRQHPVVFPGGFGDLCYRMLYSCQVGQLRLIFFCRLRTK